MSPDDQLTQQDSSQVQPHVMARQRVRGAGAVSPGPVPPPNAVEPAAAAATAEVLLQSPGDSAAVPAATGTSWQRSKFTNTREGMSKREKIMNSPPAWRLPAEGEEEEGKGGE